MKHDSRSLNLNVDRDWLSLLLHLRRATIVSYSNAELREIYNRTSGKCHICYKQLALTNYGLFGDKGAWEVEHSNARARGGTDRRNNLYAACISCNRAKGAVTTRTVRGWEGRKRAPLSRNKRMIAKRENAFLGGALGFLAGTAIAGTPLGWIGLGIGALSGYDANPDR